MRSLILKRAIERAHTGDLEKSAKQSLYVKRPLLNADDLIAWAKGQGFTSALSPDDMHVTVAYSRTAVRWQRIGEDWSSKPDYAPMSQFAGLSCGPWDNAPYKPSDPPGSLRASGGPREVKQLGDKGEVVLCFDSVALVKRWCRLREQGCSWDYPSYAPHVTITYKAPAKLFLGKVTPFTGDLLFGEEEWAPIAGNWSAKETDD